MNDFNEIVELRRKYFSAPYPADTIVEVKALYTADAMIEIEAVAVIDAAREDGCWTLPPLAASQRSASPKPCFHPSSSAGSTCATGWSSLRSPPSAPQRTVW